MMHHEGRIVFNPPKEEATRSNRVGAPAPICATVSGRDSEGPGSTPRCRVSGMVPTWSTVTAVHRSGHERLK